MCKSLKEQLEEVKGFVRSEGPAPKVPGRTGRRNNSTQNKVGPHELVLCPACACRVRGDRLNRHLERVQKKRVIGRGYSSGRVKGDVRPDRHELVSCPECACLVKNKRLARHRYAVHGVGSGRSQVNRKSKKGAGGIVWSKNSWEKRNHAAEEEVAKMAERKKAIVTNEEIRSYLERNPAPDETGKFGVPQDKYRWNFYGSGSMEYDSWSRAKIGSSD